MPHIWPGNYIYRVRLSGSVSDQPHVQDAGHHGALKEDHLSGGNTKRAPGVSSGYNNAGLGGGSLTAQSGLLATGCVQGETVRCRARSPAPRWWLLCGEAGREMMWNITMNMPRLLASAMMAAPPSTDAGEHAPRAQRRGQRHRQTDSPTLDIEQPLASSSIVHASKVPSRARRSSMKAHHREAQGWEAEEVMVSSIQF